MLRIVRDFVQWPQFLLVCDLITCGECVMEAVPKFEATVVVDPTVSFIKKCQAAGWTVGLLQHLCPRHAELIRQQKAQVKSMIEVPDFTLRKH